MRRLRGNEEGRAMALAAVVVVAGLAVLVPAGVGPILTAAHAQLGGSAEPAGGAEPGMIVVADRGNNRLQAFYPDGTFAFKIAGYGEANSIDVGPDGGIIVSHYGITAFHPNGTFAFLVADWGEGVGRVQYGGAVAVTPDGRIVVADYDRIQVFEPDGAFASVFEAGPEDAEDWGVVGMDVTPDGRIVLVGKHGGYTYSQGHVRVLHPNGTLALSFVVDAGEYSIVRDLAVGQDGRIVVGGDHFVNVYQPLPNGTFVLLPLNGTTYQPGPNGTLVAVPGIEAISYAYDVAVAPDGRIVSSSHDNRIQVFHSNGTRALTFGGYGSVESGFDRPTDAAVAPDGRIVVAEPGNRTISVFHPNGTPALSFGSHRHGDDGFYEPQQVAVGADGRIVVGDTRKHRILVFESDGTPALAFGSWGYAPGEIMGLVDVAVAPNGSIVVVDAAGYYGDGRVQVFSPDGSSVSHLWHGDIYRHWSPDRVAIGPDGRIVIMEENRPYGEHRVYAFEPNGTVAFAIGLDWDGYDVNIDVAVAPDGQIVVVQGSRVQVFSPGGGFVFATEIDVDAVSVAVGPNREIVVVDDRDDRVQVFSPNGAFAFSLLPDLSEGKFNGVGAIAIGPVMPPLRGDPDPLWTSIEPEGGGGGPILRDFTGAGDAANVTIDVAALAGPGGADALNGSESSTVTFPPAETVVAASFAEVTFPPNVTASHVPAGGLLGLRVATVVPTAEQVQAALGRNADGTGADLVVLLRSVVEVGGDQSRIVFDLPVRIALDGQAGGRVFYIEGTNGTIVPIDGACAADDMDAVHRQLGGAGECQMDSADGTAKIVYTYHLTKFGTVSIEGPVPSIVVDPAPPEPAPPPVVVVPSPEPAVVPTFGPTCSVYLAEPEFALTAMPGGYSEPFIQEVQNAGSLPFAQVEIEATPWQDAAMPLPAAPHPPLPPSTSGQVGGTAPSVFTAYLLATMPASVTEMREAGRFVGGEFIEGEDGVEYAPLADGTAIAGRGLGAGDWVDLSFRLNLTPYDALQGGTLTQGITYQAECVPP